MVEQLTLVARNVQEPGTSTGPRGERLYPPRRSRVYWHLSALRMAYENAIEKWLSNRTQGRLIDFGCGDMPYRPLFFEVVSEYVGCDLPGNSAASILIEDSCIPVEDASFDIVLSSQVLEHVDSPQQYLQEARRVLRQDGLLFLSTHGVWRYHPDPRDLWRWTSAGLYETIESAGFEVLESRGVLGPAATGIQIWQDAVLKAVPRILRPAFITVIQQVMRILDMRCGDKVRDRDASVYLVVARRR